MPITSGDVIRQEELEQWTSAINETISIPVMNEATSGSISTITSSSNTTALYSDIEKLYNRLNSMETDEYYSTTEYYNGPLGTNREAITTTWDSRLTEYTEAKASSG